AGYAQPVSPVRLEPRVLVHDQALVADQVTVAEVVALEAGWVVIHRSQAGNLDRVIGVAAVQAGVTRNLTVTIQRALATPTLYLLLHRDAGQPGVYEFPGPDAPIIVSNPPMLAFQITGLPSQSRAPATIGATQTPPVAQ